MCKPQEPYLEFNRPLDPESVFDPIGGSVFGERCTKTSTKLFDAAVPPTTKGFRNSTSSHITKPQCCRRPAVQASSSSTYSWSAAQPSFATLIEVVLPRSLIGSCTRTRLGLNQARVARLEQSLVVPSLRQAFHCCFYASLSDSGDYESVTVVLQGSPG